MGIELRNLDALNLLKRIDTDTVDLIIADPPYYKITKEKWDNQWNTEQEYLDWCKEWTTECVRVLRPGRCLYVWGTTKTDTFLRYKLNVLNSFSELTYQNWIIWHYDWGGRSRKTFARKHEDLFMYSKGKSFLFNADSIRVPYKVKTNVNRKAVNNPLGKIPTDVWEKNNHTTSKEYVNWHSTQKPLMLLERIIKANSNENDLVLDPFSGSGSTMIASANTGRSFIGSEIDGNYYSKSIERFNLYRG